LTVVDSDGVSNSTTAKVRVDKEVDYPPVANAGEDVIIHLPTSVVMLDASKSTDDRNITSWEWTRGEGADLAVDMKNTRSPVLQLSGLVVGTYSFILKVAYFFLEFSIKVSVQPFSYDDSYIGIRLYISYSVGMVEVDFRCFVC
jgi:hypothetical protein